MALKLYKKNETEEVETTANPQEQSLEIGQADAQNDSPIKAEADLAELEQSTSAEEKRKRSKERVITTSALLEILETAQGRTLSTVVLTIITVAALILFAIAPALSTITAQVEKNDALREKIQKMSDKYNNLNTLKTKQDSNQTALTNFDNYFASYSSSANVSGKRQKEIYTELSTLVSQNGFSFVNIGFSEGQSGLRNYKDLKLNDKLKFQRIRLGITGARANLPNLLTALETQKRIYQVESINISTQKESGGSDSIDLILDTIYWQLPS